MEIIFLVSVVISIIFLKELFIGETTKKKLQICGVNFIFNYRDYHKTIQEINNYPKEKLTAICEAGYKDIFVSRDRFITKSKLTKKGYNFGYAFTFNLDIFYLSDKNEKVIVDKNENDLFNILDYLYGSIICKKLDTYKGVNIIYMTNNKAVEITKKALDSLPEYVLKKFALESYTLYILNDEEFLKKYNKQNTKHVAGYHDGKNKEIVIREETYKNYMLETIYHEFGHFIDRHGCSKNGHFFATIYDDEIRNLYRYAKNNLSDKIDKYYLSDVAEFFAYISSSYFLNEEIDRKYHKVFERALVALSAKV